MKPIFFYSVGGICLFIGLSWVLVRVDAFESLYRLYKEYELSYSPEFGH